MSFRSRVVPWLWLIVVPALLFSGGVRAATDEERAAARGLAKQAAKAFNDERFVDAIDLFNRAEALVHSPVHLLFIARAHEHQGELVKAQETYVKITREKLDAQSPKAFRQAQEQARRELDELEPRVASLTIKIEGAKPEQAIVTLDGEEVPAVLVGVPMPVDPGKRVLEARVEGGDVETRSITLGEGQSESIEFVLEAPFEPVTRAPEAPEEDDDPVASEGDGSYLTPIGWTSIGLGAIGLGVGGYFFFDAQSLDERADERADACTNCDDLVGPGAVEARAIRGLDNQAASQRTNAAVAGSVGGAFIVTGVVLLLLDGGSSESARITPGFGPGWAMMELNAVF